MNREGKPKNLFIREKERQKMANFQNHIEIDFSFEKMIWPSNMSPTNAIQLEKYSFVDTRKVYENISTIR